MSPDQLRSLRRRLGLSQKRLAELVGLEGSTADRAIRRYEAGDRAVSGPIDRLVRAAVRWPAVRRWLERGAPE